MANRPGFAADLDDVNQDVSDNVNAMLSVVQERSSQRRPSTSSPSSRVPDSDRSTTPATPRTARLSPPRKASRPREQTRDVSLVNVTTRIGRDTKELLAEAALRQKLAKAVPDTEQAIIEEALQQWFRRAGYKPRDAAAEPSPASDAEPTEQGG